MSGEQFKIDPSYKEVPERIREFRAKYPEGSLREHRPWQIVVVGSQSYLAYTAAAYRHPDDPAPGIGSAWEPVPGKTPYTRESELQNAETSAWGRAIIAALASDSKKVASAEDVQISNARQAERTENQSLRRQIAAFAKEQGWDITAISSEFESDYGKPPAQASADDLRDFLDVLKARAIGAVALPPEPTDAPTGTPEGEAREPADVTPGEAETGRSASPGTDSPGAVDAPPSAPGVHPHEFRSAADRSGTCRVEGCGQRPGDPIHVQPDAGFFRNALLGDVDKDEVKRLMRQLEMKGFGEEQVAGIDGVPISLRDLAARRIKEARA